MDDPSLYRLMAWLSPGYPVGGYTYSHGLEAAVSEGLVTDRASLARWIETILCDGDGWVDACVFSAAYDSAWRQDWGALETIRSHAVAQRPSAEIALETEAQGAAFLTVTMSGEIMRRGREQRSS